MAQPNGPLYLPYFLLNVKPFSSSSGKEYGLTKPRKYD